MIKTCIINMIAPDDTETEAKCIGCSEQQVKPNCFAPELVAVDRGSI